jgi:hypothetical protein
MSLRNNIFFNFLCVSTFCCILRLVSSSHLSNFIFNFAKSGAVLQWTETVGLCYSGLKQWGCVTVDYAQLMFSWFCNINKIVGLE